METIFTHTSAKGVEKGFVNELLTLEKHESECFKTNIILQITPQEEVKFQQSEVCCCAKNLFHIIPKALRVMFEITIILLDTTEEQPILNVL